jgi:hypothetical protein
MSEIEFLSLVDGKQEEQGNTLYLISVLGEIRALSGLFNHLQNKLL